MNKLKDVRAFLSGPIDRVEDDGVGWRNYIKKECQKRGITISFFDPCDKPKGLGSEIGVEKFKVQDLIKAGKWKEARSFVKQFRRYDLRGVDWCDFVIAKVDMNVHMCGTYDEIFTAFRENKPVFIIMGKGQKREDIPTWLISYISGPQEIFETEDECLDHLEKINKNKIKMNDRWVMIGV